MILFLEDWGRPENAGAVVHATTKNQSFIDLANVLKKMGFNNYYFHLALHDVRLLDVDPYSEDLTQEQMIWIADECAKNIWYFLREVCPVPEGNKKNRFRGNRANVAMVWSFLCGAQFMLIQPRQTGKSYSVDCLMVWILNFNRGIRTLLYTKDRPLAIKNVIRLRKLFERLPAYLNQITKKDSTNQETITVLENSNYYNTVVAQESEDDADKKGRGDTVEVRHCDEIAYCKNNHITIPTMASAMDAAKDDARREGKVAGSIFTTTAGKKDSPAGAWAYELFLESAEWNEAFYDCKNKIEFEKIVRGNSNPQSDLGKITGLFSIQGTFSHRQLGFSDEWLIGKIIDNRVSPEAALRDYYNVWTSGNEISPFTTVQLQMISNSGIEPLFREIGVGGLTVKWYYKQNELDHIMRNNPVIVGLDTSSNVGRDSTTLTFTDATSLALIGSADCNSVNLYQYAKWLAELMIKFPKILIVPENKSSAQGMIDYLIEVLPGHGIDPFKRIFNTIVHERELNPKRFENMDRHPNRMSIANQFRSSFGYTTTGTGKYSRNNLYNETLYRAIDIVADKIKDKRLIDELLGLVVIDGRIDHIKGKHDDQVVSWLLSCWFIFNARNVHYYDIVKARFLSNIIEAGEEIDYDKMKTNREQEMIRAKIESIYNEMADTDDYFEFSKLEKTIRYWESKLNRENISKFVGMSDMIDQLKEDRKMKMMKSSPAIVDDILNGFDEMRTHGFSDDFSYGSRQNNYLSAQDNSNVSPLDSINYWLQ